MRRRAPKSRLTGMGLSRGGGFASSFLIGSDAQQRKEPAVTRQDELRLSEFRSDLLRILGEIYSELCAVRRAVRPARLFGETPVEELMDLLARVIAECGADEAAAVEQRAGLALSSLAARNGRNQ